MSHHGRSPPVVVFPKDDSCIRVVTKKEKNHVLYSRMTIHMVWNNKLHVRLALGFISVLVVCILNNNQELGSFINQTKDYYTNTTFNSLFDETPYDDDDDDIPLTSDKDDDDNNINVNTKSILLSLPLTESSSSLRQHYPPPNVMPLAPPIVVKSFDYDLDYKTMLQNRHQCLRDIRQKHMDLLSPYFPIDSNPNREEEDDNNTTDTNGDYDSSSSIGSNETSSNNNSSMKSKILLVDPAFIANVGDVMLTLGEMHFIHNVMHGSSSSTTTTTNTTASTNTGSSNDHYIVQLCGYAQASNEVPKCKESLAAEEQLSTANPLGLYQPRKVALWHAGGNWGDLYHDIHRKRLDSLELLISSNYLPIVGMPQSLHYKDLYAEKNGVMGPEFSKKVSNDIWRLKDSIQKGFDKLYKSNPPPHLNNTLDPSSSNYNESLAKLELQAYQKENIILTWREHESYEIATKMYPFATNIVVPDIAFQLGPYNGRQIYHNYNQNKNDTHDNTDNDNNDEEEIPLPSTDILLFLRTDNESKDNKQYYKSTVVRNMIDQILQQGEGNKEGNKTNNIETVTNQNSTRIWRNNSPNISFTVVDWHDRLKLYKPNNPDNKNIYFTDASIQLVSSAKIIIVDRLHGAILSFLSGRPLIYIDPISNKITKSFRVALDSCPNVITEMELNAGSSHSMMYSRSVNLTDALQQGIHFLKKYNL